MALMDHQGAAYAKNLNDWKQSWMPARYAANNNLLLTHVLPFQVCRILIVHSSLNYDISKT